VLKTFADVHCGGNRDLSSDIRTEKVRIIEFEFLDILASLPDPRKEKGERHPLAFAVEVRFYTFCQVKIQKSGIEGDTLSFSL